jgi:hypothetical protein
MTKVQLYLIAVMALTGYVQPQEIPKEAPKARLVTSYSTKRSACEHRMAVIDHFLGELSDDPTAHGYVVVYPVTKPLWIGENRVNQVHKHIKFRNFDPTRVTIVKGDPKKDSETEFWIVPPGADNPPLKKSDVAVDVASIGPITEPKNFTAENPDPCYWGELWLDGYAAEMNHGWEYPGKVVIYAKNLATFRKRKTELIELLAMHGVHAKRLTFLRKPLPREGEEAVELWILPVKKGTKAKDETYKG